MKFVQRSLIKTEFFISKLNKLETAALIRFLHVDLTAS